jgi:signal transduction histidine kinase
MAGPPSIILAMPPPGVFQALRSRGYDVHSAQDGYRLVELATRLQPVAVAYPIGISGPEPPELVRRLKAVATECRIVVLGARRRDDAAALLRAGCDAALSAEPEPQYLLWTLGRVLAGGLVLSPELARGLVETISESVHREQEWARSLADRTRQAETLARAKADFLGNVSHELRTPLTIIKGVASLLQRNSAADIQAELIEQVGRAADKLTTMVDNLLTLAELEHGTLQVKLAPCDLASVINEEVANAGRRYPGLVVDSSVPKVVPAHADAPRIREVVRHLLDNACRYSKPGGIVSVKSRVGEEGVTVSVTDRGQGLDRTQVAAAFGQPFTPGEEVLTKERAGLGLGLNLARNLVALQGGILWAEPIPVGGSRVTFTLPPMAAASRSDAAAEGPASTQAEPPPAPGGPPPSEPVEPPAAAADAS